MKMLLLSVMGAAALAAPALAQDAATVTVASGEHGEYLADGEGRALYLFEADTQGSGSAAVSACYDECAGAWPPLTVEGEPQGGEGADAAMLGTISRTDGSMQVTYNGWPLYYYAKDEAPGDTKGHDIEEYGAEWYLLGASGEKLHD
jgi:predicted lipoprotein with Yx(FWY)xxD motif